MKRPLQIFALFLAGCLIFALGIFAAGGLYVVKTNEAFKPFRAAVHQTFDGNGCNAHIEVSYLEQGQEYKSLTYIDAQLIPAEKANGEYWEYKNEDRVQEQLDSISNKIAAQINDSKILEDYTGIYYDSYWPWTEVKHVAECPDHGYKGSIVIMSDDVKDFMTWDDYNAITWRREKINLDDLASTPGKWFTATNPGQINAETIVGTFTMDPQTSYSATNMLTYLQNVSYCKVTVLGDPGHGYLTICPK